MKKVVVVMLAVMFGFSMCFAGDGVLFGIFIDLLKKAFATDPEAATMAVAAWTAFIAIAGIACRLFLKKVPGAGLGGLFWIIMKGLFGDGVVLENNTDPKYLQQELSKKYPALDIRIKSVEEARKMAMNSEGVRAFDGANK